MALVFQYGSNCDANEFNSKERLNGRATDHGPAQTIETFEIAFNKRSVKRGCAAADLISRKGGRHVWGVLYEVSDDDFRKLRDEIEGPSYRVKSITVENLSGTISRAKTLVVKANRRRNLLFTNAKYVGHIVGGLRTHGVPEEYVQYVIDTALNTNRRASNVPPGEYRLIAAMQLPHQFAVADALNNLLAFVEQFDPIPLLSQLSLTHLRVPADTFIGEGHDGQRWAVWIEFLAGILLTKQNPRLLILR